jgi:hypothetical protein
MKDAIAAIAGLITVVAIIPYIRDIIRGETKPNVVSWSTWTLLLIIATSAAFASHQPRTAFLTLGDTIGTGLTLLLGLKYGIAKYTKLDAFCQVGALVGIVLWLVFNSPGIAILATIAIDFIASVPTLNHSWHKPQEETWTTFGLIAFAAVLTLFSVSAHTVPSLSFPIYLLVINALISTILIYR